MKKLAFVVLILFALAIEGKTGAQSPNQNLGKIMAGVGGGPVPRTQPEPQPQTTAQQHCTIPAAWGAYKGSESGMGGSALVFEDAQKNIRFILVRSCLQGQAVPYFSITRQ